MLKCDSLILTKYARNDSFIQKKQWKCFFFSFSFIQKKQWKCFFCSLHPLKRTFFEEWRSFIARMSLFYAQKWQFNYDKIRTKWQFYSENSTETVLSHPKRIKTNFFWRTAQFYRMNDFNLWSKVTV